MFTAAEALGMTEEAIQTEVNKALTSAAMCRRVVPLGPQQLGKETVTYRPIATGTTGGLGPLTVATAIQLFQDFSLDDHQLADAEGKVRAIQNAATQLGTLEDLEIVQGAPVQTGQPPGRVALVTTLARAQLNVPNTTAVPGSVTSLPTVQRGGRLTGADVLDAVVRAIAALAVRNRSGSFGLLLHPTLLAQLDGYSPGGIKFLADVERQIGTNEIVGTSALSPGGANTVGGILFRLQPDAVDVVHTLLPRLTVLGLATGVITFRVEEEIVVRILDQTAIQYIAYP